MNQNLEIRMRRTRSAFFWTKVFGVPFWGLVNMLSIILYKDMHISPFEITLIIALKPMSALLAPYWSQATYQRPDRLLKNLIWSNILRYALFAFIPWMNSSSLIIFSFGIYMLLYRGAIPAWMELLKQYIPEEMRGRTVSYGTMVDYCGVALLPFVLGGLLDHYEMIWRLLFPITALCGMVSTIFLCRIPPLPVQKELNIEKAASSPIKQNSFTKELIKPWKHSWDLMRSHKGFATFQIGFMLGGSGLMIMQPALPSFFVDVLQLSYTKMLLALGVCKGIGFALASPFWTRLFRKINIYYFSGLVPILAALFPFFLLGARSEILWLYFAYGLYGIMQSGSDLSWHLSGPAFSQEKDSTLFSGINVITVGIRGCFVPALGAFLYSMTESKTVMLTGSILSLLAATYLIGYSYRLNQKDVVASKDKN